MPYDGIKRVTWIFIGFIGLFPGLPRGAHAHDPGLSAAELRFEHRRFVAMLTFARADIEPLVTLDSDRDGEIALAELRAAQPALEAMARDALEIRADGNRLAIQSIDVRVDESDAVRFWLRGAVPSGPRLNVRSALLANLAPGHRQYFSIRDARGGLLAERVLSAKANGMELDLAQDHRPVGHSFSEFVALGIEHILTGYDHLAFLVALLLAGGSLLSAAKIITSFTVAHSITLTLATLNLVRIPSGVVEPLIAVSVIYVGLKNLFRGDTGRRWLLTFGFGLVHGFGFASALQEIGIGSGGGVVIPLVSFNLGVELGQIGIAALALPVIWSLRRKPWLVTHLVPVCSALVALVGGYWLIERILSW